MTNDNDDYEPIAWTQEQKTTIGLGYTPRPVIGRGRYRVQWLPAIGQTQIEGIGNRDSVPGCIWAVHDLLANGYSDPERIVYRHVNVQVALDKADELNALDWDLFQATHNE